MTSANAADGRVGEGHQYPAEQVRFPERVRVSEDHDRLRRGRDSHAEAVSLVGIPRRDDLHRAVGPKCGPGAQDVVRLVVGKHEHHLLHSRRKPGPHGCLEDRRVLPVRRRHDGRFLTMLVLDRRVEGGEEAPPKPDAPADDPEKAEWQP